MEENNINVIAELEYCLVSRLVPHFLAISKEEDIYNIIVVHPTFVLLDMPERVSKVYDAIAGYDDKLLKNNVVIIQAFSGEEFESLFDYWL